MEGLVQGIAPMAFFEFAEGELLDKNVFTVGRDQASGQQFFKKLFGQVVAG